MKRSKSKKKKTIDKEAYIEDATTIQSVKRKGYYKWEEKESNMSERRVRNWKKKRIRHVISSDL